MKKEIITEELMLKKTEECINKYNNEPKNKESLRELIHNLNDIYNQSCEYSQEETIMLTWVANFPDN